MISEQTSLTASRRMALLPKDRYAIAVRERKVPATISVMWLCAKFRNRSAGRPLNLKVYARCPGTPFWSEGGEGRPPQRRMKDTYASERAKGRTNTLIRPIHSLGRLTDNMGRACRRNVQKGMITLNKGCVGLRFLPPKGGCGLRTIRKAAAFGRLVNGRE